MVLTQNLLRHIQPLSDRKIPSCRATDVENTKKTSSSSFGKDVRQSSLTKASTKDLTGPPEFEEKEPLVLPPPLAHFISESTKEAHKKGTPIFPQRYGCPVHLEILVHM